MKAERLPASTPAKPPLKWAGGKRWLLPELETLWRPYQDYRLVEPFCGGLAVALGLRPKQAILNDINVHAINFYQRLQQGLTISLAMRNDQELYYQHRQEFNRLVSGRWTFSKKAASLFYFLNRTGYNGLCRFNQKGEFNVPFGRHKRINYRRDFSMYRDVFRDWIFRHGDFATLELSGTDFVYADPPYDVTFRQYSPQGFEWADQQRLAEWLSSHSGPVVLSNQATERIIDLYQSLGFDLLFRDAPRMISCSGDRSRQQEVIACRNL